MFFLNLNQVLKSTSIYSFFIYLGEVLINTLIFIRVGYCRYYFNFLLLRRQLHGYSVVFYCVVGGGVGSESICGKDSPQKTGWTMDIHQWEIYIVFNLSHQLFLKHIQHLLFIYSLRPLYGINVT